MMKRIDNLTQPKGCWPEHQSTALRLELDVAIFEIR